jgi:hypothetical protein
MAGDPTSLPSRRRMRTSGLSSSHDVAGATQPGGGFLHLAINGTCGLCHLPDLLRNPIRLPLVVDLPGRSE